MKATHHQNNLRDFKATCSEAKIYETEKYLYKHVNMFREKTLRYWFKSGRISTLNGFVC
jgi:hypothetical protein